jgi:transposase-like protein
MKERQKNPLKTDQIYSKFPTVDECIIYLEEVRWKGKPICPYCNSRRFTPIYKERRYHCHRCNTSFSVTTRTVFHRTHLPLQKWFLAISLLLGERRPISARQLSKALKVNKNTAWLITSRIDRALSEAKQRDLLQALLKALLNL